MPLNKEQQSLVEQNMGLVGTVIRENVRDIRNIGIYTYDDLFQIGCLGLSKAAGKYVAGTRKFSTYAYISIRNEIYNALDYATIRRNGEVVTDPDTLLSLMPEWDDLGSAVSDVDAILEASRTRATGVTAKGIDAIRLLAAGYSNREIGELMGGVSANNVTAWVAKARKFLQTDPALRSLRDAI